jgi:crotonobetainyl-CoA:carnitine CoA-transferase CaiB-like acyl-CoA transferase
MPLPLEGHLVVAIEQAVAAPLATRHLADLGARVIKIERPGAGDFARQYDDYVKGMATYFVWLNRNKESVTLNTKDPRGREVLESLLSRADVFVQNLAPGAAARQGLDAASLLKRFPQLVAVDVSGFGEDGPASAKRAYDLVVQAETGAVSVTGTVGAPAKPGIAVADIAAGMYAYSTALAALLQRARRGVGAAVSVSMFDAMADWMSYSLYFTAYTGRDHLPYGIGHHAIVPYGAFPTSDDQVIVLGTQNDAEWARLATDVLGRPELADASGYVGLPNRCARRDEIHGIVRDVMARRTLADASAALDAAGIANGRLNTPKDLLCHPQLAERDRWRQVGSPAGPVQTLLPVPVVEGWTYPIEAVPALGQHSRAVLSELGFDSAQIDEYARDGVI